MKIEQKKTQGAKWEPQVKQTALLASPICKGQAKLGRRQNVQKEEAKMDWGLFFWVGPPSHLFLLLAEQNSEL